MHNEYITTCCILNEKNKLLLLKCAEEDITKISPILQSMTLELMDQCYKHVEAFHELNKETNKKYGKLEPLVVEQLKDMVFIREKFIEYFSKSGRKSKKDLLTYVFAYQMSVSYYYNYLYLAILRSIKNEFTTAFWDKHNLSNFEVSADNFTDFYILRDTKEECSTGKVDINIDAAVKVIDKHIKAYHSSTFEKVTTKLDIAKSFGKTLDNYYSEFVVLNKPYKDMTLQLVDHVIVAREMDKPRQHIKRR